MPDGRATRRSTLGRPKFCREKTSYAMLVYVAGPPEATRATMPAVGLSPEDTEEVQTWIADVEADLAGGAPVDGRTTIPTRFSCEIGQPPRHTDR